MSGSQSVPGLRAHWPAELLIHTPAQPLRLESGDALPSPSIGYQTWGKLNSERDNVVWICHALSGSSDAAQWWFGLLGRGKAIDPECHFIVCANVLGGCYGSLGPQSLAANGQPYGGAFPAITIGDMVEHQKLLAEHLGIRAIELVIGGSMGGFQALEWAVRAPELVRRVALLATSWRQPAHAVALGELQCRFIENDPKFAGGSYPLDDPPVQGLSYARQLGHLSYRTAAELDQRFARERRQDGRLQVLSYLEHQGDKLCARFDALSYLAITRALNAYDFSDQRGEPRLALKRLKQPTLVVGVLSDALYPPSESSRLAQLLSHAELKWVDSLQGHDGFLLESESIAPLVSRFLERCDGHGARRAGLASA